MRIALIASLAAALVLAPAASPTAARAAASRRRALRHLQRLAQPQRRGTADRRPVDAEQPAGEERRRDDPARSAGRGPDQRVRLRRRRRRAAALPGQLPLDLAERRRADPLPYRFAAESNTGIPSGFDLNNNGVDRRRRRRVRLRLLPGPVRDGRLLDATRSTRPGSGPSRSSSGRTCRARCCRTTRRRRRRRTGTRRPSWPSSGSRSKSHWDLPVRDRRQGRALPDQPSDAARVRRAGGPERDAQLRRDPPLGRLHHALAERLHLRRRGSHAVG